MDECLRNLKKKASSFRAPKSRVTSTYRDATGDLTKDPAAVESGLRSATTAAVAAIENDETAKHLRQEEHDEAPPPPPPARVPTEPIEQIRELQKMYLYGLKKVSELEDLDKAPDAILFGNFCGTSSTDRTWPPRKE
jgi:hypothetical protein